MKRGRKRAPDPKRPLEPSPSELVIPAFGYKNRLGIDRHFGFIRTFTVTDAAKHDGAQLGTLLDPENTARSVWADTAYRSAANVALLVRRGLVPQFQRAKPRGRPMPTNLARGNATRARGLPSSTSSPSRSAGSAWSSARSASPGPQPSSGLPIW